MAAERPVTTYSICACDLEAQQWASPQSKFLAVGSIVPWSGASGQCNRDQSYANPRYGLRRIAALEGLSAAEVIDRLTGADEESASPARHRRPSRPGGVVHRRVPRMGGRARGSVLRHARTSSSPGDRRRAGGHVRDDRRRAARGTAARLPRRGAGSRGRPARAAIGALLVVEARRGLRRPLRRARRPSRRRPPGADQRAAPPLRHPPVAVRPDAPVEVDRRGRRVAGRDRAIAGLGYERLEDWAGVENLEERVDGMDEIDPVVLEALRQAP